MNTARDLCRFAMPQLDCAGAGVANSNLRYVAFLSLLSDTWRRSKIPHVVGEIILARRGGSPAKTASSSAASPRDEEAPAGHRQR
jgi:hypothetical protein